MKKMGKVMEDVKGTVHSLLNLKGHFTQVMFCLKYAHIHFVRYTKSHSELRRNART
jgi:hypothetical protein